MTTLEEKLEEILDEPGALLAGATASRVEQIKQAFVADGWVRHSTLTHSVQSIANIPDVTHIQVIGYYLPAREEIARSPLHKVPVKRASGITEDK